MSRERFAFTPTALRSLEQDRELLERRSFQRQRIAPVLSSYLLRKEAREKTRLLRQRPLEPDTPMVCRDLIVQNALYTGDVEAVKELFPKGSSATLVVQPEGGAMRWVSDGEVRGKRGFLNKILDKIQRLQDCLLKKSIW